MAVEVQAYRDPTLLALAFVGSSGLDRVALDGGDDRDEGAPGRADDPVL